MKYEILLVILFFFCTFNESVSFLISSKTNSNSNISNIFSCQRSSRSNMNTVTKTETKIKIVVVHAGDSTNEKVPIFKDINNLVIVAMKAKEKEKLLALRNIKTAFTTKMKEVNAETLSDEDALIILKKLQKMRKESIDMFKTASGREDMIAQEQLELGIIEGYLPQLADEATTKKWVEEAIAESGATSGKEMGKVMGIIMKNHKNDVDGQLVREITTTLLNQ